MVILAVFAGIAFLILIHEFGHFLVAKLSGLLVEEFGFGFPPRIFAKKIGETVYSINLLPFGGFVKMFGENAPVSLTADKAAPTNVEQKANLGRSFFVQPAWRRAAIIAAGVLMNFILGWFLLSVIFLIGTPQVVLISEVFSDSPAARAGILPEDQVKGFKTAHDFVDFVAKNRGQEITLTIQRGGEELNITAMPRLEEDAALGVGVVEAGVPRYSFFRAFAEGFKSAIFVVGGIIAAFLNLFWGLLTQGRVAIDVVGPIGLFGIATEAGALGFLYLTQLIAIISLNLAVLNIMPFPALDGGRLLFIAFEKIKGKRLSQNFENVANTMGFIILITLMLAVTISDIIHLF